MNIEEDFNEFYNMFLIQNKENFNQIEEHRQRAIQERKRDNILILVGEIILLLIIICAFVFLGFQEETEAIIVFCGCATLFFPALLALRKHRALVAYEKAYREKIIESLVKSFCPSLEYFPGGKLTPEDFNEINKEYYNNFYSSNLIRGNYMSDIVKIAKVITQYSYSDYSTNNRSGNYETFDGLLAKIELTKSFNTELYLKKKESINQKSFNVFVADINQVSKTKEAENYLKKNYSKIDVDELNNIFNIYSSNVDYAKNIFSPETNQDLIDINNIEPFELSIKDNYIYIKFWIAGLFSNPPLAENADDKKIIYKNYKMLYVIFYLLSKLKEKM